MIDLTPVIEALVALLAAVIVRYLVPWIKGKTTDSQREQMLAWVEIAVSAAQQLYHQADGASRKEYVKEFLAVKGYDVDSAEIDSAIEAAVLKLHQALE